MSTKVTTQALGEMLAQRAGINKRAADTFIKAFVQTVIDGGVKDGNIKIKGLGTFKVTKVADRESTNVNTGERIVINGYSKMSFSSDVEIAADGGEAVDEQPVAEAKQEHEAEVQPTTTPAVEENEAPAAVSEENADTEVMPETVTAEPQPMAEEPESETEEPRSETEEPQPATEEPQPEPIVTDEAEVIAESETKHEPEVITEQETQETKDSEIHQAEEEPSKPETESEHNQESSQEQAAVQRLLTEPKSQAEPTPGSKSVFAENKWLWISVAAALLITVLLVCLLPKDEVKRAKEAEPAQQAEQVVAAPTPTADEANATETTAQEPKEEVQKPTRPKVHILQKGDSPTTISVQYYNTKDSMWAIIRLNNFPDPNNIPIGTEVKLP